MPQIAIVTQNKAKFTEFSEVLAAVENYRLEWLDSAEAALTRIADKAPSLLIIDEKVDKFTNLEIARKIIVVNAMVNLALVSSLSDEAFHEAAEGLGIIYKIAPVPQKRHATELREAFERIAVLS